jgi:hypothetical protein
VPFSRTKGAAVIGPDEYLRSAAEFCRKAADRAVADFQLKLKLLALADKIERLRVEKK